jgi:acrylyl-CoA reductase (NADPH)
MRTFKAYRLHEQGGKVSGRFEHLKQEDLPPGEVVIQVAYSGINYKDALAATGTGKIVRSFPLIGGIDLSGTVVESTDQRFREGQEVIATSFDIGVSHDGGYSELARIPAKWVVPLPKGLSLEESMILGP